MECMVLMLVAGVALALYCLLCFAFVLQAMFQHDQALLGQICIVTTFFPGIGPLIAFYVGWVNARTWGLTSTMTNGTLCMLLLCFGFIVFQASSSNLGKNSSALFQTVAQSVGGSKRP